MSTTGQPHTEDLEPFRGKASMKSFNYSQDTTKDPILLTTAVWQDGHPVVDTVLLFLCDSNDVWLELHGNKRFAAQTDYLLHGEPSTSANQTGCCKGNAPMRPACCQGMPSEGDHCTLWPCHSQACFADTVNWWSTKVWWHFHLLWSFSQRNDLLCMPKLLSTGIG